jgi:hypothetical protein
MKLKLGLHLLLAAPVAMGASTAQAAPAAPLAITSAVTSHAVVNGEARGITSVFKPSDRHIYCVIKLNRIGTTAVRYVWASVDAGGYKNVKIFDKTTPKKTINRARGDISFSKDWPTGNYKVMIYLDGKLAKVLPYSVS